MRWIKTTNHKDIGSLYMWFAFTMLLIGGAFAMGIVQPNAGAPPSMKKVLNKMLPANGKFKGRFIGGEKWKNPRLESSRITGNLSLFILSKKLSKSIVSTPCPVGSIYLSGLLSTYVYAI
jgi:hypothetical protein